MCVSLCCVLRVAVEALRILLCRAQLDAVVKPLDQEGAWDKMKDSQQHTTGVTLLSRYTPVLRHLILFVVCELFYLFSFVKGDAYGSRIVLEDS